MGIYSFYFNSKLFIFFKLRRCKKFAPTEDQIAEQKATKSIFRSLQMVLAYNQTDWTYGWAHYMDGFSIFYSPKGEGKSQIIKKLSC